MVRLIGAIVVFLGTWAPVAADPGTDFFEKKIRPILVSHCYECHSSQAKRLRGGLNLETRSGVLRGGDSGPAITPGKPTESLLLAAVRYDRPDVRMPPRGKLTAEQIGDVERWIAMGAPDPRSAPSTTRPTAGSARTNHWSYQPLRKVSVPPIHDQGWPRRGLDRFILARLEAKSLRPGVDADPAALLRRLCFDVIGLPPTGQQLDQLTVFPDSSAVARIIDELLSSPHFGERWGRHWLDVARYADSSGGGRSLLFPDAWRYRDYVIDSFNNDVPFDQFVREQIAGDLLPAATPEQRARQLIATGFLALGPTNYERQDKEVLETDVIDEQLDTIGRTLIGQTIGCARCHDHKFDPISTREYYALAGILRSSQTLIHDNVSRWVDHSLPMPPSLEAAVRKHEAQIAELKKEAAKSKDAMAKLKKVQQSGPKRLVAMGVRDAEKVEDFWICVRGNYHNRGQTVPRGFLNVLPVHPASRIPAGQSGRRQLADWIASPDNPLIARVFVNRVWHHLFGTGLVRTVDNFGTVGESPSHPELLDWLSRRFIENGWSIKWLIREIVSSRTYQMAAGRAPASDPENRLRSVASRRRLSAESIRDAILSVSGRLDRSPRGMAYPSNLASEIGFRDNSTRRSVYLPIFRNQLPELLEVFDFPDPNLVVGRRNISTVAPQSLFLMNSEFIQEQSRETARRLKADFPDDDQRLDELFRAALGRVPRDSERAAVQSYLRDEDHSVQVWERVVAALFGCIDFRYVE